MLQALSSGNMLLLDRKASLNILFKIITPMRKIANLSFF